jgi:hypothetical protein
MKASHLLIVFFVGILFSTIAQQEAPPQGINYQAVVYSDNVNENPGLEVPGQLLMNQSIGVRFTILVTSATGTEVYKETHTTNTDNFGLFTLIIGQGNQISAQSFDAIDWGAGYHFLKVEIDKSGGTNYLDMGTQQMWSVPYALYAKYAETAGNGIDDIIDNGDGTITFNYTDGSSYTTGPLGAPGPQGATGVDGQDGASAYEIWLAQGNIGTETDFINSLTGPQGPQGTDGAPGNGISNVSFSNDSLTLVFTDGSDTTIYIGTGTSNNVSIGDYYQGGIVFYLDPSGTGGLIVMPTDLMNYTNNYTWTDANNVCNNVKCNGYTDWYLPSLTELLMIYNNLGNAGFRDEYWSASTAPVVRWYWSSTPVNGSASNGVNFDNGTQGTWTNSNDLRIRGIRAFSF